MFLRNIVSGEDRTHYIYVHIIVYNIYIDGYCYII